MLRSRVAFVVVLLLLAAGLSLHTAGASNAQLPAVAPALQATPAVAPTPLAPNAPPVEAPISQSTEQVLLILGLAVLGVAVIGGGIYLRRRWIATRY
jgi:hypothetical protein